MKFRKTLFFEIPSKNFILPVYKEEDVNTLKSFLQEDEVKFSIGLKNKEDENGFYYIGQVKDLTETFPLKEFPLVYRKRVLDILNGFQEEPQYFEIDVKPQTIRKIITLEPTKNGPVSHLYDYSEENIRYAKKRNADIIMKDISVLVNTHSYQNEVISKNEIFYQLKNPNY